MIKMSLKLWSIQTVSYGSTVTAKDGCAQAKLSRAPDAERIVKLVASHIRQEVTTNRPIVSAELPGGGERFEGLLPPVVSAPCFSIRKGAAKIFTLADYVSAETMTKAQADALSYAVNAKLNILIVGGTSSGKTTLANALLAEIANCNDRVLILEDTRELQCGAEDTVALRTHGQDVKLADLVRSTLRLRPDRIVVGEVRGLEALDMLKAWNTGHPGGIATVHANSAEAGIYRIEQLILEGVSSVPRTLIAEAINVIVFISGRGPARRVETIARVLGVHGDEYDFEPLAPNFTPLKLIPKTNP